MEAVHGAGTLDGSRGGRKKRYCAPPPPLHPLQNVIPIASERAVPPAQATCGSARVASAKSTAAWWRRLPFYRARTSAMA